ncbi:MAG: Rpn family recombination-promoting nuclease/putative transposase [Bacteroidales bacterium]|nr:Rpn family recombination-promoting nuclease/putative transposase [Bacteroidales bacterium]
MEKNKQFSNSFNSWFVGKYLDPKADLTFKLVFGEHPDLVMSLLNALLPLEPDGQITSVEYLTPEMVPENPGKKNSVVDVRCHDQQGRQFIVEMQLYWNPYFQQRVILNASKAVVKQLDSGENYSLIQPVYCLCLVNDVGFVSGPDEFYHDYAIVNTEHPERRIEGLRFVFVELPKFKPKTIAEKKMAVLWLRFLTEIGRNKDEAPAELLDNEMTSKALGIVAKSSMSESQLYAYERFWMSVYDEEAYLVGRYNRGLAEGRAEGEAKGRAEGEAKGRENEKNDTVRRMKKMGFIASDIAQITQMTLEEVNSIL